MGKTSGYHPVSLHVIRGAAEYCGWKIGKIKRIAEFPSEEKAVYYAEIERSPRGSDDWSPKMYRRQLQHCFMDDIRVTMVKLSTTSEAQAMLTVQLHKSPMVSTLERLNNPLEDEAV